MAQPRLCKLGHFPKAGDLPALSRVQPQILADPARSLRLQLVERAAISFMGYLLFGLSSNLPSTRTGSSDGTYLRNSPRRVSLPTNGRMGILFLSVMPGLAGSN